MRSSIALVLFLLIANIGRTQETPTKAKKKSPAAAGRIETPPPTSPPLQPVDIQALPPGCEQLDLFLLTGQSNMKGRGVMPTEPKRDPRIVMMHIKDDAWYLARHPLHLTGDAKTFAGHDNAGVGPGLTFAEELVARDSKPAVGLVPCAVGGSSIRLWQKGAKLFEEAVRRAKSAVQSTSKHQARIRGILWLQGEANAKADELPLHAERLSATIAAFRSDLGDPELPFIACTIGEMGDADRLAPQQAMNAILLDLPKRVPFTACVDARDLKTHIGDHVHFDTAAQTEIGRRFARAYLEIKKP